MSNLPADFFIHADLARAPDGRFPTQEQLEHIVSDLRPLAIHIDAAHPDPANARTGHAIDRIAASLRQYRQRKPIVVNREEGNKVEAGNGTWQAAKSIGWEWIAATFVADDPMTAVGYAVADNRLNELSSWDHETLWLQLSSLDPELNLATGFNEEELEALRELAEAAGVKPDFGVDPNARPNPRRLPIDVIYTLQMCDCTCCLAIQAGLRYGIQSAKYRLCPYIGMLSGRHEVYFIDNNYFDYDHAVHLQAVESIRPKYATVRDAMTEAQCRKEGIAYHELGQILDWAEELAEYAENVIVIPKYDCLDRIPEKFILGYSIPTSHGGTPLPPALFAGRRVHLLGGSWKAQLAHMAELGEDVVSVDNNHILRIATDFGQFVMPNGETRSVADLNIPIVNPRYVALALSFGAVGAKVNELYGNVEL